jgi:hypothetical protein
VAYRHVGFNRITNRSCCCDYGGKLSAMFPKAGGQYVYIKKEAYGLARRICMVGVFVIQTGTIAAVAFSKFAVYLFPSLVIKHIYELGDLN